MVRKYWMAVFASLGLANLAACLDFHAKELDVEVTPVPVKKEWSDEIPSEESDAKGEESPIEGEHKV